MLNQEKKATQRWLSASVYGLRLSCRHLAELRFPSAEPATETERCVLLCLFYVWFLTFKEISVRVLVEHELKRTDSVTTYDMKCSLCKIVCNKIILCKLMMAVFISHNQQLLEKGENLISSYHIVIFEVSFPRIQSIQRNKEEYSPMKGTKLIDRNCL